MSVTGTLHKLETNEPAQRPLHYLTQNVERYGVTVLGTVDQNGPEQDQTGVLQASAGEEEAATCRILTYGF